jgi:GSH-dependent disulfide-bond oxidoreductase
MIKFHYNLTPEPMKVALMLEELGLSFEAIPVDTRKLQHLAPEYLSLNPSAKVPTIQDGELSVFDSHAILLYLAEREHKFLAFSDSGAIRAQTLSWLMFIASSLGPASEQLIHYRYVASKSNDYAFNRCDQEALTQWDIVEEHLSTRTFFIDDRYSIVDMAFWAWARSLPYVLGSGEASWLRYPNVSRVYQMIEKRPAVARLAALKDKHSFKVARRYRPSTS